MFPTREEALKLIRDGLSKKFDKISFVGSG